MDIESIIERIQLGEKSAYAEIVVRFQKPLFGFLGRMGLGRAVCEEIAQETFVRAWLNLGRYDPSISRFSTWIFTIARNLALREIETVQRRPEYSVALPEIPCDRHDPHEKLVHSRSIDRLQQALRSLSPADRSLLALAYSENMEMAEIASIEGCSKGALKVRIHRAKRRLQDFMEKDDG
ncbi:MAG TPA: sigma-70 family RNA polymerase sigma factor [Burkholderiales bacterium]|nr:sigma-70 family RNA polymerase sigma factor [Burkholderiales bacterium]